MTNYPVQVNRFVGTTKECFYDFINRHPGLKAHALLAEFCLPADRAEPTVGIEKVQRWQRGAYFPGGDALLRLRCFLHLAGYEVIELKKLSGDAQRLARIIGIGLAETIATQRHLGYKSEDALHSLWRILLQNGGYVDDVGTKINDFNERHKQALERHEKEWSDRITALIDELAPAAQAPEKITPPSIHPGVPTAFARLVAATMALGTTLLSDPDAQRAAVEATRGGHDMKELRGMIQQFFPEEENTS